MKRLLLGLALLSLTATTFANGTGIIRRLQVGRNGNEVFVQLEGTVAPVACRTREDFHYYLNLNPASNPAAREIYAALLAAKTSGQLVEIQSTASCDPVGNGLEVLGYIILN